MDWTYAAKPVKSSRKRSLSKVDAMTIEEIIDVLNRLSDKNKAVYLSFLEALIAQQVKQTE